MRPGLRGWSICVRVGVVDQDSVIALRKHTNTPSLTFFLSYYQRKHTCAHMYSHHRRTGYIIYFAFKKTNIESNVDPQSYMHTKRFYTGILIHTDRLKLHGKTYRKVQTQIAFFSQEELNRGVFTSSAVESGFL